MHYRLNYTRLNNARMDGLGRFVQCYSGAHALSRGGSAAATAQEAAYAEL